MENILGTKLGDRYLIEELVGVGGMCNVYRAFDAEALRTVAVKILRDEYAADEEYLRRFRNESRAINALSHPNIVKIYDVVLDAPNPYLVMEYVSGITLKEYIEQKKPISGRTAANIAGLVLTALQCAHENGIVHRDVKPQNIMVTEKGEVKVMDFGIARVMSKSNTLTKEALGSVHYISPEQAKGGHTDNRSDIYSLAVVMYEMMTGRPPYDGESPVAVAIQHINGGAPLPSTLNPNIPRGLEQIIMKGMALEVNDRYVSATEMLHDMEEFRKNPDIPAPEQAVTDEPTRVVPVAKIKEENERIYQKSQEIRRRSQEVSGDKSAQRPPERRREREHEEEPERRRGVPPILFAVLAIVIFVAGMLFFVYQFLIKGLFSPAKEYTVPDLTPYTIEELEERPELTQGFKTEIGQQVSSDEYPSGQIMDQSPKAGSTVKEGANMVITLTVSWPSPRRSGPG